MSSASINDVEAMVSRIDDVTAAISEILHEDPAVKLAQRRAREEQREQERRRREQLRLDAVKMRYEPKFYSRFARDDLIDALLREADGTNRGGRAESLANAAAAMDLSLYARSERVSIEEAQKLKADAATAVQLADWAKAEAQYTAAITLLSGIAEGDEPVQQLLVVLRNNRALVRNKLGEFVGAVEDATFVLAADPRNVKARLRRATALRRLHRPVEALTDVAEVLKREPRNAEALQQQQWLERAEAELAESERFVEDEARQHQATGRGAAAALCAAVEVLKRETNLTGRAEGDGARQPESPPSSPEVMETVAQALLSVSRVIDAHLMAAAVLFVVRGGVAPTVQLVVSGLATSSTSPAQRAVLLQALAVLTAVLELSELALQETAASDMRTLTVALVRTVANAISDGQTEDTHRKGALHSDTSSLVCASVHCLTQLAKAYPSLTVEALASCTATCDVLVELLQRASSSSRLLLHACVGLLDALMDGGASDSGEKERVTTQLDKLLFAAMPPSSRNSNGQSLLMWVAEMVAGFLEEKEERGRVGVNNSGADLATTSAMRLQGLRFLLRLTCFASSPACASRGRTQSITDCVCAPHFTHGLHTAAVRSLSGNPSAEQALGCVELDALYAVIHNVILTAPSRQRYLQEGWLSQTAAFTPPLFTLTLSFLLAQPTGQGQRGFLFTTVCAHMLATLTKLCPSHTAGKADTRHITLDTVKQLAKAEPTLWAWLEVVSKELPSSEGSSATLCASVAEHLVTLLGYLFIQRKDLLPPSTSPFIRFSDATDDSGAQQATGPAAVDALFACLSAGRCFTEASVVALGEGGRATPAVTPLVLLGSTALLISSVVERFPRHAACYRVLVERKAVDVLLPILREARTSLLMLRREAAKGENARVRPTLDLWIGHTSQTQQNLCVAIGKVCAVQPASIVRHDNGDGDSLLDRLHKLNGLETLAAAFEKK